MAVIGTAAMQLVHTFQGSYTHFVISNADTVPGAIMVGVVHLIIGYCEDEWELTHSHLLIGSESFEECIKDRQCKPCWEDDDCRTEAHSTIICAIMFSGITTGTGLFLIGKFKLGRLISFVPLTVEAAFLAGCGWKIVKTGIFFLVEDPVSEFLKLVGQVTSWEDLAMRSLVTPVAMVTMGIFILWAEKHFHHHKYHQATLPILLVFLCTLVYAAMMVLAITWDGDLWENFEKLLADARAPTEGGVFPVLPRNTSWLMDHKTDIVWQPLPQFLPEEHDFNILRVKWKAIFSMEQLISFVILNVVTVLAILLNSSAIEEESGQDVDFDHELKITGVGNIVSGCLGGIIGYPSVSKTMLCKNLGGSYHAGLWAFVYYMLYIAVGHGVAFKFVPVPVLGAFIFAIGAELLLEWLILLRKRVTEAEYREVTVKLDCSPHTATRFGCSPERLIADRLGLDAVLPHDHPLCPRVPCWNTCVTSHVCITIQQHTRD